MAGPMKIEIIGEVANPDSVSLKTLPRHSLIICEARLEKGEIAFVDS